MPASEFRRASFPSLRIMTDAEDTVEESEILSVEAFRRELNSDAARERFFTGVVAGLSSVTSPASGDSGTDPLPLAAGLDLGKTLDLLVLVLDVLAFMDTSSSLSLLSSSRRVEAALKERARRIRPLRPPLRTMAGVGEGSSTLSSLDMRFSAAVKVPCDKGDGRAGRAAGTGELDTADERGEAVEPDELDDRFRLWIMR
jgi:hypothetical protein